MARSSKEEEAEAVVIGSGVAASVVTNRLAKAGIQTIGLERGHEYRGENEPVHAGNRNAKIYPKIGERLFFWGRQFPNVFRQRLGAYEMRQMWSQQALVGAMKGGTRFYAGVMIPPREETFREHWPTGVNLKTLEPYFREADEYLRPTYIPNLLTQDPSDSQYNHRAAALRQAAAIVGRPWSAVKVAVNFGDEYNPTRNRYGAYQLGCNKCGECSANCPQGAKNTPDKTFLAEAEALGCEVRTLHLVKYVEYTKRGCIVHYEKYNEEGYVEKVGKIRGRIVCLSAGTFGSTELLLKSQARGLLPCLSNAIGTRFSTNGNVLGGSMKPGTPKANYNVGPDIASAIDYGSFAIEDFSNPSWAAGIVGESQIKRIMTLALALAGYRSKCLEKQVKDFLVYVGVGDDGARGRLQLNCFGMLSLVWPGGLTNEPDMMALDKAMEQLASVQGREYVPNIFSLLNRPFTYHPLGGCPMGDDEETSVVDPYGRVWGNPGLYVVDASVIPTAIGRNPSYTNYANSLRMAEQIVRDYFKKFK